MNCPYCGAETLSDGDVWMCKECAKEICECCADNHNCKEGE